MERAYEQMHERVQQGLGPQGFEVEASDKTVTKLNKGN
jgi:hypothetical protein